jgi:hypothetical protein
LFFTYEWTQEARVFQNTTLEMLAREKHSSLLGHSLVTKKVIVTKKIKLFEYSSRDLIHNTSFLS